MLHSGENLAVFRTGDSSVLKMSGTWGSCGRELERADSRDSGQISLVEMCRAEHAIEGAVL